MAILSANKQMAIANAKLRAIEDALVDEEIESRPEIPGIPRVRDDVRTREWVNTNYSLKSMNLENHSPWKDPPRRTGNDLLADLIPTQTTRNVANCAQGAFGQTSLIPSPIPRNVAKGAHGASGCAFVSSTPIRDITGSQLIETLTSANQQMVAGLAKQNLPKCQPDTFSGDATLFHPWKRAFKAMISDIDVSPEQEINYIRKFTSGDVQRVVDNFRKRQQHDPAALLRNLWTELGRRFGSAAMITNALLERLHESAAFGESDNVKLQEFADVCADVDSQIACLPGLACLNYPNAIRPITEKLPASLRAKWEKEIARHAERNNDAYPEFHSFMQVIQEQARTKNHPNILAGTRPSFRRKERFENRRTLATSIQPDEMRPHMPSRERKYCPYHEREGHDLTECKVFGAKSLEEKTEWIQKAKLCFLCLSDEHRAKDCEAKRSCSICGDSRHMSLLHKDKEAKLEQEKGASNSPETVKPKCTTVCGERGGGVSCSKMILIDVFVKQRPDLTHRVYAIVDDQSNTSLISGKLADMLGAEGPEEKYYLTTCSSDNEVRYGRRVKNLVARSVVGDQQSDLPTLVECDDIPEDKSEIPTPGMAESFPHLQEIAKEIPTLDHAAGVHILLGRDEPELLKVRASRNGPRGAPWAQKLLLGWTMSGRVCLDLVREPVHIQTRRTMVKGDRRDLRLLDPGSNDGEEYEILPCPNKVQISDSAIQGYTDRLKTDVFYSRPSDHEKGHSQEDHKFLEIMEKGTHKNRSGNWEMPLPFRREISMPNNRRQAVQRFYSLLRSLKRRPQMQKDYVEFMGKIIEKCHASKVPTKEVDAPAGQSWYLPHFGVYHPKKPTQIRVVFDSSAEFEGVSLNKELLPGPDLMNSLHGVLIRFRREPIAIMCDIEQMFHSFHVSPRHRDFLRFLWFEDNDPEKPLTEYRMNVHLFGNGPSPAVATYGLRKTADQGEQACKEVKKFVSRNFYVDDGLASLPTPEEAIRLVKSAQTVLATARLRLHKIVSNSLEVMEAFPTSDRAKDLRDLDLQHDALPAQRSLGVYWDLEKDAFTFRVTLPEKPFTRRGVLSVVNSVYDPLGLAVPVMLEGRKLLQQLILLGKRKGNNEPLGWDDPLPERLMNQWQGWRDALKHLQEVSVSRCYRPLSFGATKRAELHAFSDASQDAIAAVVYLRLFNSNSDIAVTLVYGQAKVAPSHPISIPRLELCGAVMATQAVAKVLKEIDMEISQVVYYTDSKVVIGYITNESRRFYVYVANRVQAIRSLSMPHQWRHIESERNPADLATRGIHARNLCDSVWLKGPDFLKTNTDVPQCREPTLLTKDDPEVRKEVTSHKTKCEETKERGLGTERFKRFSHFSSLRRALANLIVWTREFKRQKNDCVKKGNHERKGLRPPTSEELELATTLIIRETQKDGFDKDIQQQLFRPNQKDANHQRDATKLKNRGNSHLYQLDPFANANKIIRVGGRLRRAQMEFGDKHPILLPKGHHISELLVRHFHEQVHHQGRQITGGAIRQAGYWLIGAHRMIARMLNSCVLCKKLRGPALQQRMADLPADRTEAVPPFTNVGMDVFGPWAIQTRRTRGGSAESKRWGLVFTCLSSRAVHIEVLEAMDASAFICALRRFFSLRGPAALLRCDNGTNFVGGKSELDRGGMTEMDSEKVQRFVAQQGCEWRFNPPHASHFGGVWERQIGTIRRVLEGMFAQLGRTQLTHEILVTLMAEVSAIVNARPIAGIPTDTGNAQPLSPSMILTMKTRPLGPPSGEFVPADLYARRRWRRTQYLADQFWSRWRQEYLQSLQARNKWKHPKRNLANGDIVLMKEDGLGRNSWPMGRVTDAVESEDGLVRKASVAVYRDGRLKTMFRPVKELVLLIPIEEQKTG